MVGRFLLLVLSFFSYLAFAEATISPDNLNKRLERLKLELEEQRQLYNIPGLAIVVVKDGKPILTEGFGFKSLDKQLKVTTQTLFPIGSTSKGFTGVLAGIRVDDGAIGWDTPITEYLPYYRFVQDDKAVPITIKDLLSHRTGYARNDTLWANPELTRQQVLQAAPSAEPVAAYQQEYHYNNVMYLAAGLASAHDKEFDWDGLLQQRLLQPLEMGSTTTDYAQAIADPRLATGYYWHDLDQTHYVLPTQDLHNIAPATGLYSNAKDMAKWLAFLLNEGKANGQQLIQPETLRETLTPITTISPVYSYGLGWNLTDYQGELLLEHSGNGEGYSAQMALLPETGIGFALMMNVSISPLQAASINLVFDTLLQEIAPPVEPQDYSALFGEYIANFEPYDNDVYTFKMQGSKPAVDIPGQTAYLLRERDADGKFYFEITDQVAISFATDEQGQTISMTLHEGPDDFLLPKKQPIEPGSKAALEIEQNNLAAFKRIAGLMDTAAQRKAFEKLGTITLKGSLWMQQAGVTGTVEVKLTGGLDYSIKQDYGQYGHVATKVTSNVGFNKRLRHQYGLKGKYLELALREHPLNYLYWQQLYQGVAIDGDPASDELLTVTLKSTELPDAKATVDPNTGVLTSLDFTFIDPVWGQFPRSISYADYKSVAGLNIPRSIEIDDHETGKTILAIESVACDVCH